MSLVGKIQSLFLDREKTQPIFPITKVKAVSDDNGVGLNVLLDEMNADIKAQEEAYLTKTLNFNAKTLCFSIKGCDIGWNARFPVTLHIATQNPYAGFIQLSTHSYNGSPTSDNFLYYGNIPIISFKYQVNGDTTTYVLESNEWQFWGQVEIRYINNYIVTPLNNITLDSGIPMTQFQDGVLEQIGAATIYQGLPSRHPTDFGIQSDRVTSDNIDDITVQGIYFTDGMSPWCQTIVITSFWSTMQLQFSWEGTMRSRIKWGGNWSAWCTYTTV